MSMVFADKNHEKIKNQSLINGISDQVATLSSLSSSSSSQQISPTLEIPNVKQQQQQQLLVQQQQQATLPSPSLASSTLAAPLPAPLSPPTNTAPTATATGAAQTVNEGSTVTLDGRASSGNQLTYQWTQTGGPPVTLSSPNSAVTTFIAPNVTQVTAFKFQLTVKDASGQMDSDTVHIWVHPVIAGPPPTQTPPTAVVGQSQMVNASSPVKLDGSASFDPDGDSLTYLWTQTAGPTVMLNGTTTAKATFIAPNVSTRTTLQFKLTVTDTARLTSSAVTTITVIPVTSPPPPPPPPPTGVDRFGIKELYPTKQGGEEWFINMNNPNDGRNSAPSLQKNPDGSFKATSTQVRWGIFTSSGFHPDQIATYNQKNLAAKGYMQSPNDWKNVEMTGYLKVNHFTSSTTNGAAHIEFHWRGGRHTSSVPCEGTAYHSNLYETGRAKFEKELEHTAGYTTNDPQILHATNTLDGKWIGIKAVFYNLPNGSVKLEQWLDDRSSNINTPGNNWHKVLEFTDSGSWGGGHPNCGGTPTTIITWGGPIAIFRWDNIDNMDVKNLSVREIQPPQ